MSRRRTPRSGRGLAPLALAVLCGAAGARATAQQQLPPGTPSSLKEESVLKLRGHRLDTRATLYPGDPKLLGSGPSDPNYRPDLEIMKEVRSGPTKIDAEEQHAQMLALYADQSLGSIPHSTGKAPKVKLGRRSDDSGFDASLIGYAVVGLLALGTVVWRLLRMRRTMLERED